MGFMERREAWDKGKLVGQKLPLKPSGDPSGRCSSN